MTTDNGPGTDPMYNLNEQRVSPAALLRPNDLVTRTHRRARMAAILRDEHLQVTTAENGEFRARMVRRSS